MSSVVMGGRPQPVRIRRMNDIRRGGLASSHLRGPRSRVAINDPATKSSLEQQSSGQQDRNNQMSWCGSKTCLVSSNPDGVLQLQVSSITAGANVYLVHTYLDKLRICTTVKPHLVHIVWGPISYAIREVMQQVRSIIPRKFETCTTCGICR